MTMRTLFLLLVLCHVSLAGIVTFDSAPPGPLASYTEAGVTFTGVGGAGLLTFPISPNGTPAILDDNSPRLLIRADIAGGATSVSVDLGDYDQDADTLNLWIYNSSDVLLGYSTAFIDGSFTGMVTLSASASGIAYAVFGATSPALNGNSVYGDNFTFSSVPEPATFGLFAAGVLVLAARRLRR